MSWDLMVLVNSALLGVGLAMDAFSVSVADGLNEPNMKKGKTILIASVFAFFQALMPLSGWFLVRTLIIFFTAFEKFIPWVALVLLCFIGSKMIIDGIKSKEQAAKKSRLRFGSLILQGIATSIDALSVGFTIAEYSLSMAIVSALIIGLITFVICLIGLIIGKKTGNIFSNKAQIFGGIILIVIGFEILLTSIF